MSDSELARELKEHNVSIGPITSSTRDVYRRKLAKLKAEQTRGELFDTFIGTSSPIFLFSAVSQSSSAITVASESDEEFSSSSEEADPKPQVIIHLNYLTHLCEHS